MFTDSGPGLGVTSYFVHCWKQNGHVFKHAAHFALHYSFICTKRQSVNLDGLPMCGKQNELMW